LLGRVSLFLVGLVFATSAVAQSDERESPDFGRNGPYVGISGSYALPLDWSGDFHGPFNAAASDLANASAQASLDAMNSQAGFQEIVIRSSGVDLDDGLLGFGAVVGYRVAPNAALEVEGEWLTGSNASSFTIENTGDTGTAEVKDLWTITANVRVYPLTGRLQPYGVFGLGVYHSTLDVRARTTGLTTPTDGIPPVVSADFAIDSSESSLDGALRAGAGLDAYVTAHFAARVGFDYVYPFVDTGFVKTDYISIRFGLLYRF
jgi:hypothetical protein